MNNEKQLQIFHMGKNFLYKMNFMKQTVMYCYQFSLTILDFSRMNFPSLYFWDAS